LWCSSCCLYHFPYLHQHIPIKTVYKPPKHNAWEVVTSQIPGNPMYWFPLLFTWIVLYLLTTPLHVQYLVLAHHEIHQDSYWWWIWNLGHVSISSYVLDTLHYLVWNAFQSCTDWFCIMQSKTSPTHFLCTLLCNYNFEMYSLVYLILYLIVPQCSYRRIINRG